VVRESRETLGCSEVGGEVSEDKMDLKKQNEFYPTIGINVESGVYQDGDNWRWRVRVHITGPDDILDRTSEPFASKAKCTMDFFTQWEKVLIELVRELSS
jgi:hypothetical protein